MRGEVDMECIAKQMNIHCDAQHNGVRVIETAKNPQTEYKNPYYNTIHISHHRSRRACILQRETIIDSRK
jgi:hypothetical protein